MWLHRHGIRRVFYSVGDDAAARDRDGDVSAVALARRDSGSRIPMWRMQTIDELLGEPGYVTKSELYVHAVRGVHLRV